MSSIHLELLDKERQATFEKLKIFRNQATLAGGTALCLQIAHRLSFDFDLFLEREIKNSDYLKLTKTFKIREIRIRTSEQITIITREDVGITLFFYPYKPLFEKVKTPSVPLFSIKDIAADKAYTIGRRATWRDYVDLFFILKWKYANILAVVGWAQKKFGVEFNPILFLEQLVYFEDLEFPQMSFIKEKCSIVQIQDFLKKQAREFKKQKV